MNKRELVKAVATDMGITKNVAEGVVDSMLSNIMNTLQNGGSVRLSGFGVFESTVRKGRVCRNPRTGESVTVPDRKYPKFRASSKLKEFMNS